MAGIAFEPIHVPDHVWRRHEAALQARDVGALFRLAKQYAGASQNRIAAATGVAQSRVNELMNRGGAVTSIEVLQRIADGLDLPDAARLCLGLAPRDTRGLHPSAAGSPPAGTAGSWRTEDAEVRALLAHAAGVTMGVSSPDAARQWTVSEDVVTPVPSRIGRTDIGQLEDVTAALRAADYLHGGGACREAASAQTRWVTRLLDVPADDDTTMRLHLTLADLQNLVGWTSLDVGLYSAARGHFAQALVHAHTAGQASLVANILYRTGRLHLHRSMTVEALRFFQLGQIAAQDSGCNVTVAVLCANEAWAYAILGDRVQATASLQRARDELGRADPASAAAWVRFFGEADLSGLAGLIHLELATADRTHISHARSELEHALALRDDDMARTRTFEQIALATACLRDEDTDTGVAIGWTAAENAARLQSVRVRDRLRPLRVAAQATPTADADQLAHHLAVPTSSRPPTHRPTHRPGHCPSPRTPTTLTPDRIDAVTRRPSGRWPEPHRRAPDRSRSTPWWRCPLRARSCGSPDQHPPGPRSPPSSPRPAGSPTTTCQRSGSGPVWTSPCRSASTWPPSGSRPPPADQRPPPPTSPRSCAPSTASTPHPTYRAGPRWTACVAD
jgi:transcriptional regulator with XRE-family HTH domain